MRSKLSIAGHPIHPILVDFPIVLFVFTLAADIVYRIRHTIGWYDLSQWTGLAAVVTALAAALFGFADYVALPLSKRTRRVGAAHMGLNLIIVTLYAIAFYLMTGRAAVDGGRLGIVIALHALGVGLLLISGWLGGSLVYHHGVGIDHESVDAAVARAEDERTRGARGEGPAPRREPGSERPR